ncbi:hypothetical protein OG920_19125 [Streptomyces europaeiscabiei]|uniref:hypothetical protein n=1 Tax=Streptomyces TaxID=1883 RepID=UPI000A3AC276|nr:MULTISPECIES: hypothetical protein [Streptomyces]MDX3582574.1 hypothetical protein [Streptomyces europaeiscabiei]
MSSLHLAEAHTTAGGRSYLYQPTWPAPAMDGVFDATQPIGTEPGVTPYPADTTHRVWADRNLQRPSAATALTRHHQDHLARARKQCPGHEAVT